LALLSLGPELQVARGDLLVLCCAVSFALHIVSVSAFAPKSDPLALTIGQVATVTLCSAVLSLLTGEAVPRPSSSTWVAAGFTGVLATAVAFGIQTAMQRFTTPTHTALIFTGEPVFAAIFGVLLAGDVLSSRGIAGGILIVVGTIISEVRWSERTARLVSRFLGPNYVAIPLVLALGLADPVSPLKGLLWSLTVGVVAILIPVLILRREIRLGKISDWHISDRRERLQAVPVVTTIVASGVPSLLLYALHGPRLLLAACLSGATLMVFNLLVTMGWKISQHVSGIAVSMTLITAVLGIAVAPTLLLIPLVAWARVKVGAHTVMQTVAGGAAGVVISMAVVRLLGIGF
jgi:hypothetical protein